MASELIPVKVAVRCRPLVEKEITEGCRPKVEFFEDYQQISLPDLEKAFTFDFLFPPSAEQDEVYKKCAPDLLDALFNGYNATILAYGQTGSGKTYTMGTAYNEGSTNPIGIIPRVIDELFQRLQENNIFYTVKVSFLEVYNEDIYDLFSTTRECVAVREDNNGIKVAGMQEIIVKTKDDVLHHLTKGSCNRQTGATNMNKVSSRSHALFTITVQLTNEENTTTSKFHLVDLAGSEKAKKTGAQGDRFKEGININKGLFALGNVISALCDKSSHIPYRDSRLTRLLQDSLGGNSHTIMIACISPADSNLEETLNTLRYADRARKIKNRPIVNVAPGEKELAEIKQKYNVLQSMWTEHMDSCPKTTQSEPPASQSVKTKDVSTSPISEHSRKVSDSQTTKTEGGCNKLPEMKHDQNNSISAVSPKGVALQTEMENLMRTNQQLILNWRESNNAANTNARKFEQMESTMNDWKLRFEDFSSEISKMEKNAADSGAPMLPKEILDFVSNFSEVIAFPADPEPETKPVVEVSPDELTEIQNCLKDLEQNLSEKQSELVKQQAITEDLKPLQRIAEKQKNQIQQLEKEKSELEDCMKKNPSARISEDRRKKISELEKHVCLLRKQLEMNQKALKSKESVERRVKALNSEILILKQSKVSMQKRHEVVQRQMREEKIKAAQQAAQASKKMNTLLFANQKLECRKNVLEQKLREVEVTRKRLETVLSKRDATSAAKGTKQKGQTKNPQKIYEFLSAELECTVRIEELKQHMEELKNDRTNLTAERAKQQRELEEITAEPPVKKFLSEGEESSDSNADIRAKELTESIKFIEESLNVRSEQITRLTKQIILFDPDEQKQNLKKFFECPQDLEKGLHYLFQVAARESRTVSKNKQEIQELKEKLESERAVKISLERKNEELTKKHEMERWEERKQSQTRLSMLEREHRSKILELLHDASSISMFSIQEGSNSKLIDQIQKQANEINSLNDIQEELKKKEEECDLLQKELKLVKESNQPNRRQTFFVDVSQIVAPAKPKPKPKPKVQTRLVETVEEEEEELFVSDEDDDQNDPDWQKTPHAKTRRASRNQTQPPPTFADSETDGEQEKQDTKAAKKKSLKRSTSASNCSCTLGNCKNNRCTCRKRSAICTSQCKCSKDSCTNNKMILSPEESDFNMTFIGTSSVAEKENVPQNHDQAMKTDTDQSKGEKPAKTRKLYTSNNSEFFSFPHD